MQGDLAPTIREWTRTPPESSTHCRTDIDAVVLVDIRYSLSRYHASNDRYLACSFYRACGNQFE